MLIGDDAYSSQEDDKVLGYASFYLLGTAYTIQTINDRSECTLSKTENPIKLANSLLKNGLPKDLISYLPEMHKRSVQYVNNDKLVTEILKKINTTSPVDRSKLCKRFDLEMENRFFRAAQAFTVATKSKNGKIPHDDLHNVANNAIKTCIKSHQKESKDSFKLEKYCSCTIMSVIPNLSAKELMFITIEPEQMKNKVAIAANKCSGR